MRGIKHEGNETEEVSLSKMKVEMFPTIINQKLSTIQSIHSIRKKAPVRDRPIILNVTAFIEGITILKNCFNLKGTQISINEDHSKKCCGSQKEPV